MPRAANSRAPDSPYNGFNVLKVNKSYTVPFSLDQVFSAWVSNDFAVPPVTEIYVERKVGGVFRLTTEPESAQGIMQGRIQEFEPSRLIKYTWRWGDDGPASTVEVRFSGNNEQTRIDLTHSGLDSEASLANHGAGWDSYIEGLRKLLSTRST